MSAPRVGAAPTGVPRHRAARTGGAVPGGRRPGRARAACATLVSVLGTALTALSVLALLGLAVGPRTGTYRTLTMLTGSMRPLYPPGAVLVDTPEPLSRLRVGQVLTYQIPVLDHRVESHRVTAIARRPDGSADVQTKGDANNGPDPWRAHIVPGRLWVVRGAVPGLGAVIAALRRPDLRATLRYLLPAVLLGWVLLGIWTPRRRPAIAAGTAQPARHADR